MTDLSSLDPVVFTVPEAAHVLRCSDQLLYEMISRGDLPAVELGRRRMIPRKAIDLLIDKAMAGFDADLALASLAGAARPTDSCLGEHAGGRTGTAGPSSVHLLRDPSPPRG